MSLCALFYLFVVFEVKILLHLILFRTLSLKYVEIHQMSFLYEMGCLYDFFCLLGFGDRISLCGPDCPGTHSIEQAGLELRNSPACAS